MNKEIFKGAVGQEVVEYLTEEVNKMNRVSDIKINPLFFIGSLIEVFATKKAIKILLKLINNIDYHGAKTKDPRDNYEI